VQVGRWWYETLLKLDYVGITILVSGPAISLFYYVFYCHNWLVNLYTVADLTVAVLGAWLTLSPSFQMPEWRLARAAAFAGIAVFAVIPMAHGLLFLRHPSAAEASLGSLIYRLVWGMLLVAALSVAGALAYAMRFPERLAPGRFDVFLSSHQLFHISVRLW
jgi:adiponectin receptor